MRVDLFIAISKEGTKVRFDRDQEGVTKDSHLAERKLTPSQAKKLYQSTREAFNAKVTELGL